MLLLSDIPRLRIVKHCRLTVSCPPYISVESTKAIPIKLMQIRGISDSCNIDSWILRDLFDVSAMEG